MAHAFHNRLRRARRVRAKIQGTPARPRASVWRGRRALVVQLIDDAGQRTLLAVDSRVLQPQGAKTDVARAVGEAVAGKARELGIQQVVFDRGGYRYHGRVKAAAEAMRAGGLDF